MKQNFSLSNLKIKSNDNICDTSINMQSAIKNLQSVNNDNIKYNTDNKNII
jgi:hypothetical protein